MFAEAELTQSDALQLQQMGWILGRRGASATQPSEAQQSSNDHHSKLFLAQQVLEAFWLHLAGATQLTNWRSWIRSVKKSHSEQTFGQEAAQVEFEDVPYSQPRASEAQKPQTLLGELSAKPAHHTELVHYKLYTPSSEPNLPQGLQQGAGMVPCY